MMRRIAFLIGVLCVTAGQLLPAASYAQCRLCGAASDTQAGDDPKMPIELEVESILSFDRLVQIGPGDGVAVLQPDGTKTVSGSLGDFSGSGIVGTAVVRGDPGRMLRIDIPKIIQLYSLAGGQATVDEIVTDLPSAPRLDANGRLSFRFGGRLKVNGEADGDYRGELPITAEYL